MLNQFIKLTSYGSNREIYISIPHIIEIEEKTMQDGCIINLVDCSHVEVREALLQIVTQLRSSTTEQKEAIIPW